MNDKILSFMGICRKAGSLVLGRGAVKESAEKGKIRLVLISSDLSERSEREAQNLCSEFNVEVLKLKVSMEDIGRLIGKSCGIIGISDEKMAKKINEIVIESGKEECIL